MMKRKAAARLRAAPIPLEHLPFLRNKKSPPHGGTVLTPAEAKFRGGGAAPLLV